MESVLESSGEAATLETLRSESAAAPDPHARWDGDLAWEGGAAIDSRVVRPGDLFFALPGERTDGHHFVADALARGAAAAFVRRGDWAGLRPAASAGLAAGGAVLQVEDPLKAMQTLARWHRRRVGARLVAVTGSAGKTTTKELVGLVCAATRETMVSHGNLNNQIGLPLALLGLRARQRVAVVEMGASRPGDVAELAAIAEPDLGIITGVGAAHLATFGSLEGVLEAKWELARALPADGLLVLNGDDPLLRARAAGARRCVTVGFAAGADLRGESPEPVADGSARPGARMRVDGEEIRLRLLGRGALRAALAAIAVGREFGLAVGEAGRALAEAVPLPGRLYPRRLGETVLLDDTYNASPPAVANALEVLAAWPGARRRILVMSDMLELGEGSAAAHREAGRLAGAARLDLLFVWGEWAGEIESGALEAGLPAGAIRRADSREALARDLARSLEAGDVVLLKASRGRRLDEVVKRLVDGGAP